MKFRSLLLTHSIIYMAFAIVLFCLPSSLWPLYGLEINDRYAYFLSQHNSIFLGGLAIIAWLFRDIEGNTPAAKKLTLGLLWSNILGVSVTLYACLSGVFVGFGWSDPIFFAFLSVLCLIRLKKSNA